MSKKSRFAAALLIAVIPFGGLRRVLWNKLLGYKIHPGASVAPLNFIAVDSFELGAGSSIGIWNYFKGPFAVKIGTKSRIGRSNKFVCGTHLTDPKFAHMNYARILEIGDECLVLHGHYFDVYGRVELGSGTWIAGIDGQFWTHGISAMDRDIIIGKNNYIGSGVRFAPGTSIGDENIVALGSVILSSMTGTNMLISGFPAKEIKSIEEKKARGEYRFSFEDW